MNLIFETILIFIVINVTEFLLLYIFKVNKNIIISLIINNIFGTIMLFFMNYLNVFIVNTSLIDIIVTSTTGIFGLIALLIF